MELETNKLNELWKQKTWGSGYARYEYRCPHCRALNLRYYNCARIVCNFCKKVFYG